jgi:hypothetical protein
VIRVFTSPTTDEIPILYDYDHPPRDFTHGSMRTLLRPHWDKHAHAYTAFTPLEVPYEGPIFGRLRFNTPRGLPPIVDGERVAGKNLRQLDPSIITQWERLEVGLCVVIYLLKKRPECQAGWDGIDYNNIPLPHCFGYQKGHHDDKQARRAAFRS